jgi:F-type H+-transporting ATPase subunit b
MRVSRFITTICFLLAMAVGSRALAQEHAPTPQPPASHEAAAPKGAQPTEPAHADTAHKAEDEHHDEGWTPMIARAFNFALLIGALVYFLKSPIATYLSSRSGQIRQDLVSAEQMRTAAAAQLAEIQQKMATLPGELEALTRQGAEDVKAERERISRAAEHERTRLLDQTRREIDMRLRVAKRDLTEHAAQLAVQVAEQRIKRSITPDDQMRLVDRYASQLKEAR